MYQSTKRYDHNAGFSACFRQWKAKSHCQFLHGYALAFEFVFEATQLDENNWVVDFGGLKPLKKMLEDCFDHKTLVAKDDPNYDWYLEGQSRGVLDLIEMDATGCEKTAEYVYKCTAEWLKETGHYPRVHLRSVKVSEHAGNSAVYEIQLVY